MGVIPDETEPERKFIYELYPRRRHIGHYFLDGNRIADPACQPLEIGLREFVRTMRPFDIIFPDIPDKYVQVPPKVSVIRYNVAFHYVFAGRCGKIHVSPPFRNHIHSGDGLPRREQPSPGYGSFHFSRTLF